MDPSSVKIQVGFFLFALVLFLFAALSPKGLILLLGRGRVVPAKTTLFIFRMVAIACVFGSAYRLLNLLRP